MPAIRGRAIIYPLLLLTVWAGGRIAYLHSNAVSTRAVAWATPNGATRHRTVMATRMARAALTPIQTAQYNEITGLSEMRQGSTRLPFRSSLGRGPGFTAILAKLPEPDLPEKTGPSFHGIAAPPADSRSQKRQSFFGYAYSFWRIGDRGKAALAPAGQYGGSQSGLMLGYDLGGSANRGLAAFTRAIVAPSAAGEELAFGLRWQRPATLPVSLNVERRLIDDAPDRWAVYAAGGVNDIALPARFELDAYGQAGWTLGRGGSPFFDAQAHATRKIEEDPKLAIRAGAGAWTGGQKGLGRLDVGPTVMADVAVAKTSINLRFDWRHRIAGNARPGSGAAVTLSTGF